MTTLHGNLSLLFFFLLFYLGVQSNVVPCHQLTESLQLVLSSLQQYDVPEVVRLSAW